MRNIVGLSALIFVGIAGTAAAQSPFPQSVTF